jgi:hypothetical protein
MGDDSAYREEGPAHAVSVSGFWMDAHEVTNAQFYILRGNVAERCDLEATGYRERGLSKLIGISTLQKFAFINSLGLKHSTQLIK